MDRITGISVKELLDLPVLKDSKVLAGLGGINRRVTKVNVMEVPDIIDWVTHGEILLTTTYSIKDDLEKLKRLILQFNNKGLAGLGIKTKRYLKEVPDAILQLSNELEFPLIEIPYDASYSEVIMEVSAEIINKQTNALIMIDRFHNQLIDVMLKGGSLKEIGNIIYKNVDNTVAIVENIFKSHILISRDNYKEGIEEILLNEDLDKDSDQFLNRGKGSHSYFIDNIKGRSIRRIAIPISTESRNYGHVYIWEDKRELTSLDITSIESSTSIIALDLIKRLSIFQVESKHKVEFLDDLFSRDEKLQKKAADQAAYFGFNKTMKYSVIVIKSNNIDKIIKSTPNNTNFLHQLNEKLLSIMERLPKATKQRLIYGNKSDRIIALFGIPLDKSLREEKREVLEFSKTISAYTEVEHIKDIITIGIGRSYRDIYDLWRSYREASRAVESLKGKDSIIHYDDLGIYRILSYEDMKPELIQFYKETLEPLVDYDKEKGSDLVETLRKYCECGGNLKQVSHEMYTHYNTIIYRMKRINEIINIDLENYNDRLNVEISLKIYDMIKES